MFDTAESAAARIVEQAWKQGLAPDPVLTVDEWANRHRMLSSVSSAEPGRWSTGRTPYLKAVMEALSVTTRAQRVVLMAGAQIGKTEAGLNWLGVVVGSIYRAEHPAAADSADVSRTLFKDGAVVEYDRAQHHWRLAVPAGGQIVLEIGPTRLELSAQGVRISGPRIDLN